MQGLTVGLVIAAGISYFSASWAAYFSLLDAKLNFYTKQNLCEGFVYLNRAPSYIESKIVSLPGISKFETRISKEIVLDLEGEVYPSAAQLVSLPKHINTLYLKNGFLPKQNEDVIISENFAVANNLGPGSVLSSIIGGKRVFLHVTGVGLSPEFVYVFRPGNPMPDDKHYGIIWMKREAMEANFNFEGAFNQVVFHFASEGEERLRTIKDLDVILDEFGGSGAKERKRLPSDSFLNDEFRQLKTTAVFLPGIFLAIAAFLLHIISNRLISKEREQIATLRALGYGSKDIIIHYLKLITCITAVSSVAGVSIGYFLGNGLTELYGRFYKFPQLLPIFPPLLALFSIGFGILIGGIGTFISLRSIIQLDPAQAMRPAPPGAYTISFWEGWITNLRTIHRMVLRNLFKRPTRTILTILGLSTSIMIMIIGNFIQDTVGTLLDLQFNTIQRETLTLVFRIPVDDSILFDIKEKKGVFLAEGQRSIPIKITKDRKTKDSILTGISEGSELRRILNQNLQPIDIPVYGIMMNTDLALKMGIKRGETITIETLDGEKRKIPVVVSAFANEILGQGVFINRANLNRILNEGNLINTALLKTDPEEDKNLIQEFKDNSLVIGLYSKSAILNGFKEVMQRSLQSTSIIILIFTIIISIGVIYNTAMITLSERIYELGSLRILGFTLKEVFEIIAWELIWQILIAIPVGCFFGNQLANLILNSNETEGFKVPAVIYPSTYYYSILLAITTALISFVIVYRKLKTMDLLSVLKVRE
ncbi:ABC transporter permease [Leptospira kanakyensis]|uniref:ABC transporter permease n=2 Tax=Leptospira kanakyensis TaxID=2484968 RepID=A0A6N4QPT3_9LEPT|nr:ABC transporter permease [Leptospira kanakyensis]TGK56428.1 ABC transporter permease [Leptospira kanakyensis]TGK75864.1 ABC transporter permease [Leptospira kanakyensis]